MIEKFDGDFLSFFPQFGNESLAEYSDIKMELGT